MRFSLLLISSFLLLVIAVLEVAAFTNPAGSPGSESHSDPPRPGSGPRGEQDMLHDDDDGDIDPMLGGPGELDPTREDPVQALLLSHQGGAKLSKTCTHPDAPKVGEVMTLHIPSHEHLITRFHGMKVFSPVPPENYKRRKGHTRRTTKEIFDEHHRARLLYVFDSHQINAVWPAHAYDHGGRNLKVRLTDVFVTKEVPHTADGGQDPNGEPIEMCFFNVQLTM